MVISTKQGELVFEEKAHKYFFNGEEQTSVTSWIGTFFPTFDTKGMSKRVAKRRRNDGEKNAKGKPITAWDVRREWNHKKEVSIARGNLVHNELEWWISKQLDPAVYPVLHDATKQGILWSDLELTNHEVRCEEQVVAPELQLAGTIDLLYTDRDTLITHLADWKSNVGTLEKKYGNLQHPVLNKYKIPNSKLGKYFLQLNVYKRLIELAGFRCGKMTIVHVADNAFREYEVPDWKEIVDAMFEHRRNEIKCLKNL